jgi:hypothetical protein
MSEFSSSDSPESHNAEGSRPAEQAGPRQLVLVKKGQRYIFRYDEGGESQMLSHLVELVLQGQSNLDWFDAAVLSHQMGQRLSHKLERIHKA